ncbi:aminopeptidase, partial [Patescibacteria group bacterium]|nr:aminopeptidase [Patescibacteria group bacterium]
MRIVKKLFPKQIIRQLSDKEFHVGANVIKNNLKLKPGEKVLIVTDHYKEKIEAAIFFEAAKKFTKNVELISFNGMTENAQEPEENVAKKMKQADTALLVTTYSLSHTQARQKACQAGARIISLPGITREMILRTLSVDYSEISKLCQKLQTVMNRGSQVTITSPAGTNLKLSIRNRFALSDTGNFSKPGSFGNLPAGETFIAPIENKTEGIVVFDGAIADIELDKPIILEIKAGKTISISGGKAAKQLKHLIELAGEKAKIVCEFGIGTNKTTKLCPEVLEAEKVFGTCHLAFGNNAT